MGSSGTLQVLTYGAKVLRKKARPVTAFEGMELLGRQMLEEMHRSRGVGLAAPQVGIDQRIIVADASSFDATQQPMVLINPEIIERRGEEAGIEGCLSLPGIEVEVKRAKEIRVRAQAVDGKPLDLLLKNFPARILQHEIDHLDGILLLDYLPPFERILAIWKLRKRGWRTDSEFLKEKERQTLVSQL
jgi:peptide deformylase